MGTVPRSTSCGVHISKLIRFARMSNHVTDFNARNKMLTGKRLHQGYRYHKLRKSFSKFFRRHYELVSKFKVGLKSLLHQGLLEPEFYGTWSINGKQNGQRADFSDQFRKVIMRYKRIGYNINVMRQSTCLVINPITGDSFAPLFNWSCIGLNDGPSIKLVDLFKLVGTELSIVCCLIILGSTCCFLLSRYFSAIVLHPVVLHVHNTFLLSPHL